MQFQIFLPKTAKQLQFLHKHAAPVYCEAQLANTTKDITSIMLDCGYQNQQVFNRNFKKLLGITPSQYRERCFHFSLHPVDDQKQVVFLNQLVEGQNQVYLNGKYV